MNLSTSACKLEKQWNTWEYPVIILHKLLKNISKCNFQTQIIPASRHFFIQQKQSLYCAFLPWLFGYAPNTRCVGVYCIHQTCIYCQMLPQKCQLLLEEEYKSKQRCPGDRLMLMVAMIKFLIGHSNTKITQFGLFLKIKPVHSTNIFSYLGDTKTMVAEAQRHGLFL